MAKLTMRRLDAIIEALNSRLAGERDTDGDPDAPTEADYDNALSWAVGEQAKRAKRKGRVDD